MGAKEPALTGGKQRQVQLLSSLPNKVQHKIMHIMAAGKGTKSPNAQSHVSHSVI